MKAEKWNFQTREYEPYELPPGAVLDAEYTDKIQCADCGKPLHYRDSYTSSRIHSYAGFGYAICHDCMLQELEERKEAWKN